MARIEVGQTRKVTRERGTMSWLGFDGLTVIRRGDQLTLGDTILIVESCEMISGRPGEVWKGLTRYGMRYFLFTALKSATEPL